MHRALASFSCGAASAVAAKMAVEKYGDICTVYYCDTFAYEHPDNKRFFAEVEDWIGVKIKILKSQEYKDIYDVFDKTGWLVGAEGARCTTELKKNVRKAYQKPDDIHIIGYTSDEPKRVRRFRRQNPELFTDFILHEGNITKKDCYRIIQEAGIRLPEMYLLGYKNNNCIGCVKGGMGYWNKIKRDFPEYFDRMAKQERKMKVAINKREVGKRGTPEHQSIPVYLDELKPWMGRHHKDEPDIECGVMCIHESEEDDG